MINPYYTYFLTFFIALAAYQLNWSRLYPPLSFSLLFFLLLTMLTSLAIGVVFHVKRWITYQPIAYNRNVISITLFIVALWAVEFIYAGGIPLLKLISGETYDYRLFGVPSLHVFVVTFNCFFSIYLFHMYRSTKRRKVFLLYALNMLFPLLIINRGMFLMNVAASLFVYLLQINHISFKRIVSISVFLIVLLYFFGVFGDFRTTRAANVPYSSRLILDIGEATPDFVVSAVPKEYFWTYLYAASPLANLQYNVDKRDSEALTVKGFVEYVNNELNFDFISKRTNILLSTERAGYLTIAPFLTVATVYARSFSYLSWPGLILTAMFILLFGIVYVSLLRKSSPFFVTGIAILNTLYFFLIFDNMFAFTGLSFQLVYPLLFSAFSKIKILSNTVSHPRV